MTTRPTAIIVGAGLSGLTCAIELTRNNIDCTVFERNARVGGRVRTDEVDGFRLDRGFQVLLTAYPETERMLDYRALRLKPFFPGAVIANSGRMTSLADPWRRPIAGLGSLMTGTVSLADGLRMARLRARLRAGGSAADRPDNEKTTLQRLRAEGFSEQLIETFFRPFFGGVFLDRDLQTSERQFEFVFRMFGAGDIAVPSLGMGAISEQLAAGLPDGAVHTGADVTSVDAQGVSVEGAGRRDADAVVIAADGADASRLSEQIGEPQWRAVSCLYFAAPKPPMRGARLLLDGDGSGPINNLCVMSEVAPDTAPSDQALISATVLGTGHGQRLEQDVRAQLAGWFGADVERWRHLKTYRIDRALPDQSPPRPAPAPERLADGVYVCGDYRHDGSINGAMASGRRTARALIHDLRETRQ
jgi:phytoene dehydrogenase-like protein